MFLIYISVAVCRFCAVSYLIFICFYLLFSNYSTYVFIVSFLFSILCILCFSIVLCIVSHFVLSLTSVQAYPPLPPGGNPITVNKYISYHIIYHKSVSYSNAIINSIC
jgi:hypothetical protein